MITVVLADDHAVVRQGLRTLLEAQPDMKVIGQAGDGLEALQLLDHLRPDVLVVDLMMPGLNGIEVARTVRQHLPQTHIVVLSMHANEAYVLEALHVGASAYVLKAAHSDELITAIREAAAGHRYLGSPLSEHAIAAYLEKSKVAALDPYETLTERERQVLHLVAEGRGNADIADALSISPRTAETHRSNLMHKLGLHSHTDVIRYALRRGLIPMQDEN